MEIAQDEWDFDRVSGLTTHKLQGKSCLQITLNHFQILGLLKIHQTKLASFTFLSMIKHEYCSLAHYPDFEGDWGTRNGRH